jgi:hypothetical protein
MTESFPNEVKSICPQIQKVNKPQAQETFKKKIKKTTLRYITIKLLKNNDEEKLSKVATKERYIMYGETEIE